MAKLVLVNIFVLILLVTVVWMTISSEVVNGDEIQPCEDTWYDEDCYTRLNSVTCGQDCMAKYPNSNATVAYCNGSNCSCLYQCNDV